MFYEALRNMVATPILQNSSLCSTMNPIKIKLNFRFKMKTQSDDLGANIAMNHLLIYKAFNIRIKMIPRIGIHLMFSKQLKKHI